MKFMNFSIRQADLSAPIVKIALTFGVELSMLVRCVTSRAQLFEVVPS